MESGLMTQEELAEAYEKLYKSKELASIELKLVKESISANKTGLINYNEFLNHLLSMEEEFRRSHLKQAFDAAVLFRP